MDKRGFGTRAVHVGQEPDPATGAVVPPIHMATTFAQDGVGNLRAGYEYGRSGNPTRSALEASLCSLEAGQHALAFSSGLAATTAVMLMLSPGDRVLYMEDVYGGTFRLLDKVMHRYGVHAEAVDASDLDHLQSRIDADTKLIWLETPSNPLLRIVDIAAVARIAQAKGITFCVDNTFATPVLQHPLELGADLVLHSATKYLGGHSDVVSGVVVTNREDLAESLRFHQNAVGSVPSPFDCWLLLRGIKTLELRVNRQCESALAIARHLEGHAGVNRVYYPGLPSHGGHAIASAQMGGRFGGMVSFEVADEQTALSVLAKLKTFTLAESLGAVESLAEHPAAMTHASVPRVERERIGISDALIRLSVGIEDVSDLIDDLDQALT